MTNEILVRALAEKAHEAWRQANPNNKWNLPFDDLPEDKQESAMADVRVTIDAYEQAMNPPKPAEPAPVAEAPKRKPLQPKGLVEKAVAQLQNARKEPAEEGPVGAENPALSNPTPSPAGTPEHVDRVNAALLTIAADLRALPNEDERRKLAMLSIHSLAFNATNGDFLLATGLLQRAAVELPNFYNLVLAQRAEGK